MKNLFTFITFIALLGISISLRKYHYVTFKSGNTRCDFITHTVQTGDGLWSIANKYHDNLDELIKRNNIQNPNLIYGGQQIQVCIQQYELCVRSIFNQRCEWKNLY